MKKFLTSILGVMLTMLILAGCGAKSPSELILGKWKIEEQPDMGWEFFSGGSVVIFNESEQDEGTWSISEETLKISDPSGQETLLLKIEELTKNQLILCEEESGETVTFIKTK